MTQQAPVSQSHPRPMVAPFPKPGPKVRNAYRELHLAQHGTPEQREQIGNTAWLPRPWDPASCTDPDLRSQVWDWLDHVTAWVNTEYTWDIPAMIPTCWPHHPHLVHELAVLADQRHRAGQALTSDALEEWHRYALPAFLDRMRGQLRSHCDEGHQPWPGRSRHNQHISDHDTTQRQAVYTRDRDAHTHEADESSAVRHHAARLELVDVDTGEVQDGQRD